MTNKLRMISPQSKKQGILQESTGANLNKVTTQVTHHTPVVKKQVTVEHQHSPSRVVEVRETHSPAPR